MRWSLWLLAGFGALTLRLYQHDDIAHLRYLADVLLFTLALAVACLQRALMRRCAAGLGPDD